MFIAGRYEVRETLGEGAYGVVYRCLDTTMDRAVALKLLKRVDSEEARERFLREGRLASRLDHPHVVRTLDQGVTDSGSPYLVTELVEGESLADVLSHRESIPVAQARTWIEHILEGLAAAHAAGIAHRDLKPANVMISASSALLTDFGLARADDQPTLTAVGHLVGTPGFMAPEVLTSSPANERSDLWAAGALGYELFYGQRWRSSLDLTQLEAEARRPPTPDPERFGRFPDLDPVLAWLLAGPPEQRPESPDVALAALRGEVPVPAPLSSASQPKDPLPEPPPPPAASGRTRNAVLALSAAGAIGLLGVSSLQTPTPLAPPPSASTLPPSPETTELARSRENLNRSLPSRESLSGRAADEVILAGLTDPATSLRWRRFLRALLVAEQDRTGSPTHEWLADACKATSRFLTRAHHLDLSFQQMLVENAFGAPGAQEAQEAQTWQIRRGELQEISQAHLEEVERDLRSDPSAAFVTHLLAMGRWTTLPTPQRWLALVDGLLDEPGGALLAFHLARYLRGDAAGGAEGRRRYFRRLVDWLDRQPMDTSKRTGLVGELSFLAAAVLRDQYPTPEVATLDRFDRLLEELGRRATRDDTGARDALSRLEAEMRRETAAKLLGASETPTESWEPYRARYRRVKAMRELVARN